MRKVAPDIVTFTNVLGGEFTAAMISATVNSSQELKDRVQTATSDQVAAMLGAGRQAITGESDTSDMNPQETADAVKFSLKTVDTVNKRPQRLDDNQRAALGNAFVALTTAASNTSNVRDRQQGTLKISTEQNMRTIEQNRNEAVFEEAGARLRNLNLQAFAEVAQRLQPDTTAPNIIRAGINQITGAELPVTGFVPVYDPAQGRIVMMQTGEGGELVPAKEAEGRTFAERLGSRRPPGLETDIQRANQMLNNAIRFIDYGGADVNGLSPEQIKMMLARDANLRILGQEEE
jgi:hypothetical protein